MTRSSRLIFAVVLVCIVALHARGQGLLGLGGAPTGEPVTIRATVNQSPLPQGSDAQLAIAVTIRPGYHIQSAYAPSPYVAARFKEPAAPPGVTLGEIRYPKPKTIPAPGGTGTLSVYDGKIYFLIPLQIAPDVPPGEQTIAISLTTQACDDKSCFEPKTVALKIPITIAAAGTAQTATDPDLFAAANRQDFASAPPARPAPPSSAPAAPGESSSTAPGSAITLLSAEQQQSLIAARPYIPLHADEQQHSVPVIFLFALLGGLILNVMPCVLPVIPLKALSLVQQAHGDRRVAIVHSLVFCAGIVALFVALAIVLRTFGLFYGQQFQSPAFVITMTLLVVALALSMLGVWTINPPQAVYNADAAISAPASHFSAFSRSFGNGLMATLLATPCSAPFLGGVLAWALVQPTWLAASALAVVGIGMGSPYLLLAAFPGILARFPRAGRWSELLKQGLGILMLGVAVYLVTLLPNADYWPWVLAGGIVVALVCWGWGQIPTPLMERSRIWTIRTVVLAIGIALGAGVWSIGNRFLAAGTSVNWQPFNLALLDAALKDGRPVVVDWTAAWCANCHYLEATVLNSKPVQQAFEGRNALLLKADVTADAPAEWALLKKLGFQSIPVTAVFSPDHPENPAVLPDLYTRSHLLQALSDAK